MFRVLVVYGSTYGQTNRVAHRIAAVLSSAGHVVDIHKADQLPGALWLAAYDGFVVAASVLMGHHQEYVRDFVRRNATLLNEAPSAFISVCGAASDDPPQAQAYIDALLRETGWRPTVTRSFAGAVAYTRYGWWYRWYLKMISRRKGLPTDTSRDWKLCGRSVRARARGNLGAGAPEAAGPRLLTRVIRRWREARALPQ